MTTGRRTLTILVSIQMVASLFLLFAADFADDGTWWVRRLLASHPVAVGFLLGALLFGQHNLVVRRIATLAVGLHIVGAVGISFAILSGRWQGDWSLGLALAVILAAGLAYLWTIRARAGEPEAGVSE